MNPRNYPSYRKTVVSVARQASRRKDFKKAKEYIIMLRQMDEIMASVDWYFQKQMNLTIH